MRTSLFAVLAFSIVLMCSPGALGVVTAESFVAMRHIEPPADRPYMAAGITNAGDLFGEINPEYDPDHLNHHEQPVRWLRRTSYEPEIVNGGLEHVVHPCCGGPPGGAVAPNKSYWGIHSGFVTSDGYATGSMNVHNWYTYHYDIVNDVFTALGPGQGGSGNNHGLVPSPWQDCCGAHGGGYYSKVVSVDAADAEIPYEVADWFPTFFLETDPYPSAINDQDILVGTMGGLFSVPRTPMKMMPTGENKWGDPIAMEFLGDTANGSVIDISNNPDTPYAIGSTNDHGVVWDVTTGQIIADFGPFSGAQRISSDGTKVVGSKQFFTIPPSSEPIVWSTDNGWQDYTELGLNEVLALEEPPAGADQWVEITNVRGINDAGQIVGSGDFILAGEGAARAGQGVFLLDTIPLLAVLKGDVNNDGAIDNLDITPFIAALAAEDEAAFLTQVPEGSYAAADIDDSGEPNNLDITPFIQRLTDSAGSTGAVPEPASVITLVLGCMLAHRRSRQ